MELREAIKILKGCDVVEIMPNTDDIDYSNYNQAIETVLEALENSIPIDEIEAKIEQLKNELKYIVCDENCEKCFTEYRGSNFRYCYAYYQIKVLQELLGENK